MVDTASAVAEPTPAPSSPTTANPPEPTAPSTPGEAQVAPSTPVQSTATQPETATAPTQSPTPDVDYWKWFETVDPEEALRRSRRLAGKVGELADRQARERQARWEAEREAREKEAELKRLRDEDPFKYVERQKEIEAEQEQAKKAVETSMSAADNLLMAMWNRLPPEVQTTLANKRYEGDAATSRLAFIDDVVEQLSERKATERNKKEKAAWEAEQKQLLAKREREVAEAARKEALGSVNGSEPTPDVGGGQPLNSLISQDEFDQNRRNPRWVSEHIDKINESVRHGRIRR
ncbi:MAG: hypothetical protein QG671_3510 [Actinomycetota bacterium]|nr:hypothetical protein [Actinomycetota bacterium]